MWHFFVSPDLSVRPCICLVLQSVHANQPDGVQGKANERCREERPFLFTPLSLGDKKWV